MTIGLFLVWVFVLFGICCLAFGLIHIAMVRLDNWQSRKFAITGQETRATKIVYKACHRWFKVK